MKSYFHSQFFAGNRQRLRQLFTGTAPIVVTANGLLQRGADSPFKFEQDANFWYLTGINEPDLVLVLDRDEEYLILPPRSDYQDAFDGIVDDKQLTSRSGLANLYPAEEGWKKLGERLNKVKHVAVPAAPPAYVEQYGMYTNPARAAVLNRLKSYNPRLEALDLGAHLARLRMVKQPAELEAIQAAIDVTVETLNKLTKASNLIKYAYEYEIEADLGQGFRRLGAQRHAFDPICAGGARACTLHYVANTGSLSAGELLLIDVGAQVEHYAADITRTVSLSRPSRRQEQIHQAVQDVQAEACKLLKPGVLLKEYEQQVEHIMGDKLQALGLIRSRDHSEIRRYYPHSTSHFLGLNVHDVGDYNLPLEPGMVLTVEPGIYVPEEGIGVRIEDDVLVSEKGIEVLSRRLR